MPITTERRLSGPAGQTSNVARLREPAGSGYAPQAVADTSDLYLDHLKGINATFYDQLKVVDQKAAYVFTFLIAMMIWSQEVRQHFASLAEPAASGDWILSLALAASLTIAAVSAILVVVPRDKRGGGSLYWGAWPEAGTRLGEHRSAFDPGPFADEYRANVENLADICRQKYRLVRLSYLGLLVGVVSYVLAITTP